MNSEFAWLSLLLRFGGPIFIWLGAVVLQYEIGQPFLVGLNYAVDITPDDPWLWIPTAIAIPVCWWLANQLDLIMNTGFKGAAYSRFLRGSAMAQQRRLAKLTKEPGDMQVTVADVPFPTHLENRNLLIQGAVGTGKSTALTELMHGVLLRSKKIQRSEHKDRIAAIDPDGKLMSQFWLPGDKLLNPFDVRGQGWSIFNEIQNEYDCERYATSVIPDSPDAASQRWNEFARQLLAGGMLKVMQTNPSNPSFREMHNWLTVAKLEDLAGWLKGTPAEGVFSGPVDAIGSARFIIGHHLKPHFHLQPGPFSIRDWLADPNAGNLWITWQEDMREALKPLISTWADIICTSVLSLPEDEKRSIWLDLDELGSLDALPSLEPAATKGRKRGLRIVGCVQSTSQLADNYGREKAQTIRSVFRSLLVLGGARADGQTAKDMSMALGQHEVNRRRETLSQSEKGGTGRSSSQNTKPDDIVMPSEIQGLPDLQGYLALAGEFPISRVKLTPLSLPERVPALVLRPSVKLS
ncbi:type IV secretion system DNA-binding domain-containing protein [Chitinimonas sp. BJB300]|uniref:type IV secretion system DNA-binding domain-containing protein n=1 Tax=Chitinimonas sp. BJB300 TaxID=1559339 RepID=UPI000C11B5A9|nr:type IV secretion system DNA-binding domain-containing protein [Chitinimonas sp. BJB300]PHV12025.1 type VI secretion protein [Chitinimonas sp. BJB300]TSJ84934.1 type VI secretion protein [Chitinimonas sp. BJB300]